VKKLASLLVTLFSLVWLTGAGWLPLTMPAPSGLMLDGITTGVKAAYSTRKLLTAYAGNAIQVQRISDNATQNIGFVANVLDTASLATFCSGTTCKVITWYDQSGGGSDQTIAALAGNGITFTNAPIIYQSGAVNALNTKPAILFVAATPTMLGAVSLTANPVNTLFQNAVVKINIATGTGCITSGLMNGGSSFFTYRVDQTTGALRILSESTASIAVSSAGITTNTGAVVENQYNSSTGAWSFWIDGGAQGTGTQAQALSAGTSTIGAANSSSPGSPIDGSIGEVVMYDLVGGIPSGSRTSIEANQKVYWGTP